MIDDIIFSEEDLAVLDAEVQKEMDNCNPSIVRPRESQKQNLQSPENDFTTHLADCFDDDGSPMMEHLECLKSKFHHGAFRAKQWDIIKTIIKEKRDVCAVMVR